MTTTRRLIRLTDDNWSDYLGNTIAESLVEGFNVPEDGIDRDGPQVRAREVAGEGVD
jgi:hypothetical protein